MTGAFVRIQRRNNKWVSIEIEQLTDEELTAFFKEMSKDGVKWAIFLAKWIRDNT